jgi:hypothetical protein
MRSKPHEQLSNEQRPIDAELLEWHCEELYGDLLGAVPHVAISTWETVKIYAIKEDQAVRPVKLISKGEYILAKQIISIRVSPWSELRRHV